VVSPEVFSSGLTLFHLTFEGCVNTKKIFLIDDNDYFREMAIEILVKNGYQIQESSDGEDALRCLNSGPLPDLIVSDVNMPKLNGIMLAKILRENPRFTSIPLIICSNDDLLCEVNQDYKNVFYIDKEFSQLLSAVDQLLKSVKTG
jgi:CheY-like chemotaxis protein